MLRLLEAAAADNDDWALLQLGRYTYSGAMGLNQNIGQARAYFQRSAQQGNLIATFNLAQTQSTYVPFIPPLLLRLLLKVSWFIPWRHAFLRSRLNSVHPLFLKKNPPHIESCFMPKFAVSATRMFPIPSTATPCGKSREWFSSRPLDLNSVGFRISDFQDRIFFFWLNLNSCSDF